MSSPPKRRILIVEDDAVTRMILRQFLESEPTWEVTEAQNGLEAWRLLEAGADVDLCLLDIQMPQLDGIGLLKRIRASARIGGLKVIMCTTLHDRTTVKDVSALSVEYYIVKPFKKDLILNRVRMALESRPHAPAPTPHPITRGDLRAFVRRSEIPPSLPSIYQDLVDVIGRTDSSNKQISEVILRDQGFTSSLLKLANTAFYARGSGINTVEGAVQLVGLEQISQLVLATSLIHSFKELPVGLVDVLAFWEHSLACGIASALLAEKRGDATPERLFIGGLLHDIGRLVMFINAPKESRAILERCEREKQLSWKVETEVLGFDHADVGAELLRDWGLPKSLAEIVRHHHPSLQSAFHSEDAGIVHCADFITTALQFGNSGEFHLGPLILSRSVERVLSGCLMEPFLTELEKRCRHFMPVAMSREATSIERRLSVAEFRFPPEIWNTAKACISNRFRHVPVDTPTLKALQEWALKRTAAKLTHSQAERKFA